MSLVLNFARIATPITVTRFVPWIKQLFKLQSMKVVFHLLPSFLLYRIMYYLCTQFYTREHVSPMYNSNIII